MPRPGDRKLLWVIIVLAVAARMLASLYMGDRVETLPGIHDQVSYDALARSLQAGRGYAFTQAWYPFIKPATPTAFWSFLYSAYLGGIYAVFGPHPLAARLIQSALGGALACWLLYSLGRKLFGQTVGLTAAALSAVYVYFIYYDAALMTESFYNLGILATLNLALVITGTDSPIEGESRTRQGHFTFYLLWIVLGLALGVTTLFRQSILPWVPFLFAWIWWATRKRPGRLSLKHCAIGAVVALLIVAIIILPFTLRNYRVYGQFLLLNSNAGYALYSANHPDHGTHFMQAYAAPVPAELAGLNEAQMDNELTLRGLEFMLQEPGRYALLSLSRIPIYFNFWPSPESETLSNISRVLSFGLYLPFFLYGLFLSRRNRRRCSLLYLFGLVYSLMHILTWASIRYRLPVDAAFMPFAALAVVTLAQRFLPQGMRRTRGTREEVERKGT